MRAVIITGGAMRDYAYIRQFIQPEDTVIAADSGYHHCERLGLRPRILLGDFDSLHQLPEGIETLRFPQEKNFTDTELAVDWARKEGFRNFLFLGATGTRLDHSLTNILLLSELLDHGEAGELLDEHNRVWLTDREVELDAPPGAILSLVPLTTCAGVTTENLTYPLRGATLEVGQGRGVSNVILASPAKVRLSLGKLLVMLCRD